MGLCSECHSTEVFYRLSKEIEDSAPTVPTDKTLVPQPQEELKFKVSSEDGENYVISGPTTSSIRSLTRKLEEEDIPGLRSAALDRRVHMPATEKSTVVLKKLLPSAEYDLMSQTLSLKFSMLGNMADERARRIGRYFFENAPAPELNYAFKKDRKPFRHQIIGVDEIVRSEFFGLFLDMGTGKTKCAIDSACLLALKNKQELQVSGKPYKPFRVLVICPKGVMVSWVRNFAKDATVPYAITSLCPLNIETYTERREYCIEGQDDASSLMRLFSRKDVDLHIVLVNFDRVMSNLGNLMACMFDAGYVDEAHWIKSPWAERSKAAHALAQTVKRRYALTGTPVTQWPLDLWSIFEWLSPKTGLLGAQAYGTFESIYCDRTGPKLVGKLRSLASRHSMVVLKEQCLDLPPKTFDVRSINMGKKQAELYEKVANEVLIELDKMSMAGEVSVPNVLTQYLRLAQVTSGFVKTIDNKIVDVEMPKLDALMDILEETDEKVVVWSRFVHEIESIQQRCKDASIQSVSYYGGVSSRDRQRAIDRFQDKDSGVRVFVGHAQSGGVGVELFAGTVCVYVSNDFNYGSRKQSLDRVHRVGQTKPVLYIDLLCKNSIDEYVYQKLKDKEDISSSFSSLTGLRDFIESSLKRVS
jgi:SNF2 family DNA or RNA helicase